MRTSSKKQPRFCQDTRRVARTARRAAWHAFIAADEAWRRSCAAKARTTTPVTRWENGFERSGWTGSSFIIRESSFAPTVRPGSPILRQADEYGAAIGTPALSGHRRIASLDQKLYNCRRVVWRILSAVNTSKITLVRLMRKEVISCYPHGGMIAGHSEFLD